MKKNAFLVFFIFSIWLTRGQKFQTDQGSLNNIKGVEQYNILFEYPADLKIPHYDSEEDYINSQVSKREKRKIGSGEEFKKKWFENREKRYEPAFIENFNGFRLKKRSVTVEKNNTTAKYTLVIKIVFIYPGYDITAWEEDAKLGARLEVYETGAPDKILYATKTVIVHGTLADVGEFERVLTAYTELGRWTSKFFCRKT